MQTNFNVFEDLRQILSETIKIGPARTENNSNQILSAWSPIATTT